MEEELNINEKKDIPEKKKKKKHRFLKFLLIIVIIIISIKVFKIVKQYYEDKRFSKMIEENILVSELEEVELTEEELNQDSNGDGLTNREKLEKGLDILSDDTDGDGLTDYDEINIYNSDPRKFSTSGDLFSDAEKIKKGYDINKVYNESRIIETGNENIKLIPDEAIDMQAYYKEYTGTVPSEYIFGMQPFRVYSFSGKIEVKIENPEYYEVISYDNIKKKDTKIKHKTTDELIVFDITNDNPILIVYKQNILKKLGQIASKITVDNVKETEYIVLEFPIASKIVGVPTYVLEVNDNVFKRANNIELQDRINSKLGNDNIVVAYINSLGKKVIDFFFGRFGNEMKNYFENENIDKSIIDYIFIFRRFYDTASLEKYLCKEMIDNQDESTNLEESEIIEETIYEFEEKYNNTSGEYYADSGFSVTKNAFRFANISTITSEGGNCMGFSHITSNIYNDSRLKKKIKDVYDMSSYEYDDIWSKQLYSYIPTSELATYADDIYKNEITLDADNMEKPDSEVVKCIEYYFDEINLEFVYKRAWWECAQKDSNKQVFIKSSTVDNIVKKFQNGEIVGGILFGEESMHAINAYKIVEDVNDSDILYLKVYDNNFPGDMFFLNSDGKIMIKCDITIVLKRCYKTTIFGTVEEYYEFEYNPCNNQNYYYSTFNGKNNHLMIIDEKCNKL